MELEPAATLTILPELSAAVAGHSTGVSAALHQATDWVLVTVSKTHIHRKHI